MLNHDLHERIITLPPLSLGIGTILETANYKFFSIVLDKKNLNFTEHLIQIKMIKTSWNIVQTKSISHPKYSQIIV